MTNGTDPCRDPETIAAYLDGRLSPRERDAMTAHLASCESCYALFLESAQTMTVPAQVVTSPHWWSRPRVAWSAAAGLAAAASVVLAMGLGLLQLPRSGGPALEALVAAVGTERTFVPRLTGGFAYGPVRGVVRSGQPTTVSLSPDVRIEAARIEKETEAHTSAAALQVRGIAQLITGDVDRAIAALEASANQRPTDARVLSDLASAYLVRGDQRDSRDDLSKALTTLNRALEIDRTSPEVLFNRAYALERLGLATDARDGWQSFLTIDNKSGWADEARARLRALPAQP